MTNRDTLIRRQVLLLVLVWCASTLPGVAADLGPGGTGVLNGGGSTRFGLYAAQVQSGIKEALLQNSKTRSASISGVVTRIWIDNAGRITRAQLVGTTGDPTLDSAITDKVLAGFQLQQPPPADMPMPIVLRLTAHPSRSGLYVAQVESRIEEALLQNNKTRSALILGAVIRVWVDSTARITRAQLVGTLGDPSLDSAITNEVLTGLHLQEPPPADLPMPIVVRVTTHRPS
jgi:hypothetical protein